MVHCQTYARLFLGGALTWATVLPAAQHSRQGIRHAFLATGAKTYIISHTGKQLWSYPRPTREGWMLPTGNVLLVLARARNFPGSVIEVDRRKRVHFQYRGKQHGISSACKLENGNYLIAESGRRPRLLEISPNGRVTRTVPLKSGTQDYASQVRMVRPLPKGRYLVAQPADLAVREYDRSGRVMWQVKTKEPPYTAIRLKNGHTLVGCTTGNCVVQFDSAGQVTWKLANADLKQGSLKNAYGVQRLPNGHTVVANHDAKAGAFQLIEVDAAKRVVWTFADASRSGIVHFQILNTNGRRLPWPPLR